MQKDFISKMDNLQHEMKMKDREHEEKMKEMIKIIEKKNYESHYPIPENLKNHIKDHGKPSFNIQILGCRGAGKSTFVNKFMMKAGLQIAAKTGTNETTTETAFYDITSKIVQKPDRYGKVFLCDQPGIGGLKITEAKYLSKFGPGKHIELYKFRLLTFQIWFIYFLKGHFNFTFMLGEKGFNEMDMALLKHLLHNKKPMAFIRTQCDAAINGIIDEHNDKVCLHNSDNGSTWLNWLNVFTKGNEDMTFDEAFDVLKEEFNDYMQTNVLSQVEVNDLGERTHLKE